MLSAVLGAKSDDNADAVAVTSRATAAAAQTLERAIIATRVLEPLNLKEKPVGKTVARGRRREAGREEGGGGGGGVTLVT